MDNTAWARWLFWRIAIVATVQWCGGVDDVTAWNINAAFRQGQA